MIDMRSVSLSGALASARARVIWDDGLLKIWNRDGFVTALKAEKPVKIRGYLARWDTKTERGNLEIRGKCLGCGGRKWWKFMTVSTETLWGSV